MSEVEYAELKRDISERGIQVPVEYDESGNILDGHHRVKIAKELGIPDKDIPKVIKAGLSEQEKFTHARQLNLARRHLTLEQRKLVAANMWVADPTLSVNKVAEEKVR